MNLGKNTINTIGSDSNMLNIYLNLVSWKSHIIYRWEDVTFLTNNNQLINKYIEYSLELCRSSGCFQTIYAEYDIDHKIFNFYDNFTGTKLKINWTDQADIINNSIESKKTFNMVSNIMDDYIYFIDLSGTNSNLNSMQYAGWVNPTHHTFVIADNCGTNNFNLYDIPYGGTSCLQTISPTTPYNLLSLWETPNTCSFGNIENLFSNYDFENYGSDSSYSNNYETGIANLNISTSAGTANFIYIKWIDVCNTSPNNIPNSIMPITIISG